MGILLKIFIGFWALWILWYLTGGPLRDDKAKPYIKLNNQGELQAVGKDEVK